MVLMRTVQMNKDMVGVFLATDFKCSRSCASVKVSATKKYIVLLKDLMCLWFSAAREQG